MLLKANIQIPELLDFPEVERTASLKFLLELCCRQNEQLGLQSEQIQMLRDEILILKGEKARPKIKASSLNKDKDDDSGKGSGGKNGKRGKPRRKKTKELEIHETKVIHPENIPEGAVFKGYEDYVVQGIRIKPYNTKFRKARYEVAKGEYLIGELPDSVRGSHFDPELRSYILSQYYEQRVTQNLILKHLWQLGVEISSGQLNNIIIEKHGKFHEEKADILQSGLSVSSHVNVDDTGARHKGKNGYCTHIGNEFFTWFSSSESKSRVNFLELLRAGYRDYTIDKIARGYLQLQKLPTAEQGLFLEDKVFADKASWEAHLQILGITSKLHKRIATEGALLASVVRHGISPALVIVSDDAGQFNIAGFLNALCWVHSERNINKIIPYSEANRKAQEEVRSQIWNFYQQLKEFKVAPTDKKKTILEQRFDEIFTQKTSFQMLNLALRRIYKNKIELLLVLSRPEIPLHNNLSENDIRDYVIRRKISPTTRSDTGRDARDTFLSIKKTCQKLGISFYQYLIDRLSGENNIPPMHQLIRAAAHAH